ncbi:MAG: hypothetical protein ACE5GX_03610 [Thermoanaerobaculia bacterium]
MNWTKIILAAVVGGILMNITEFVEHVLILGGTYAKYPDVFNQGEVNPLYYLAIALFIAFFAAILFSKSRRCWGDGWKGGATFGFFLGLVFFFAQFYPALTIDGFPYFLSWCWAGSKLIAMTIMGLGLGLVLKN